MNRTGCVNDRLPNLHQERVQPTRTCEKAAAVQLYNFQILPLDRVAAMFRRNPAWRSA